MTSSLFVSWWETILSHIFHHLRHMVKDEHAAYLEVSRLEIFFHELSMYEEKNFLKRYQLKQDTLQKLYHDMLSEASESERLELRQKFEDLLFNEYWVVEKSSRLDA